MEGLCNVYNDKGTNDMIYTAVLERWDVQRDNACYKQVFEVKNRGATAPTRTTCCLQSQVRTWQHVKTMQPHTESMSTQSQSGMGTHTHCALVFPSLNPHLKLYQTIWLVMHVILPSHIVFLHSRHKHNSECSDMHTGTVFSQGWREFIWVKQCSLLETIAIYKLSLRAKLSYTKHS